MYFVIRIERYKKKYDIQTYKEIVVFTNGKSLNEVEKEREKGKKSYQKILLAICSVVFVFVIAMMMTAIMRHFF